MSKLCILEVNGFSPEELSQLNVKFLNRKIIEMIEKINFVLCDRIVTVNTGIKKKISSKYRIKNNKIEVITNKVNTDLFKPYDNAKDILKLSRNFRYVCFVGNIISWQGLKYLIHAAKLINDNDIKYLIIGDGPEKKDLIELSKHLGIFVNLFL